MTLIDSMKLIDVTTFTAHLYQYACDVPHAYRVLALRLKTCFRSDRDSIPTIGSLCGLHVITLEWGGGGGGGVGVRTTLK